MALLVVQDPPEPQPLPLTACAAPPRRPIPDHPPYAMMIGDAIGTMGDAGGSTVSSISKYIRSHYDGLPWGHDRLLPYYLQKLTAQGEFIHRPGDRYLIADDPASAVVSKAGYYHSRGRGGSLKKKLKGGKKRKKQLEAGNGPDVKIHKKVVDEEREKDGKKVISQFNSDEIVEDLTPLMMIQSSETALDSTPQLNDSAKIALDSNTLRGKSRSRGMGRKRGKGRGRGRGREDGCLQGQSSNVINQLDSVEAAMTEHARVEIPAENFPMILKEPCGPLSPLMDYSLTNKESEPGQGPSLPNTEKPMNEEDRREVSNPSKLLRGSGRRNGRGRARGSGRGGLQGGSPDVINQIDSAEAAALDLNPATTEDQLGSLATDTQVPIDLEDSPMLDKEPCKSPIPSTRKRGRPMDPKKKIKPISKPMSAVNGSFPVKRGRGRPPKCREEVSGDSSSKIIGDVSSDQLGEAVALSVSKKVDGSLIPSPVQKEHPSNPDTDSKMPENVKDRSDSGTGAAVSDEPGEATEFSVSKNVDGSTNPYTDSKMPENVKNKSGSGIEAALSDEPGEAVAFSDSKNVDGLPIPPPIQNEHRSTHTDPATPHDVKTYFASDLELGLDAKKTESDLVHDERSPISSRTRGGVGGMPVNNVDASQQQELTPVDKNAGSSSLSDTQSVMDKSNKVQHEQDPSAGNETQCSKKTSSTNMGSSTASHVSPSEPIDMEKLEESIIKKEIKKSESALMSPSIDCSLQAKTTTTLNDRSDTSSPIQSTETRPAQLTDSIEIEGLDEQACLPEGISQKPSVPVPDHCEDLAQIKTTQITDNESCRLSGTDVEEEPKPIVEQEALTANEVPQKPESIDNEEQGNQIPIAESEKESPSIPVSMLNGTLPQTDEISVSNDLQKNLDQPLKKRRIGGSQKVKSKMQSDDGHNVIETSLSVPRTTRSQSLKPSDQSSEFNSPPQLSKMSKRNDKGCSPSKRNAQSSEFNSPPQLSKMSKRSDKSCSPSKRNAQSSEFNSPPQLSKMSKRNDTSKPRTSEPGAAVCEGQYVLALSRSLSDASVLKNDEKASDASVLKNDEKVSDTSVLKNNEKVSDASVLKNDEKVSDASVLKSDEKVSDTSVLKNDEKVSDTSVLKNDEKVSDASVLMNDEKVSDSSVLKNDEKVSDSSVLKNNEKVSKAKTPSPSPLYKRHLRSSKDNFA